jgi:hypothetical protein
MGKKYWKKFQSPRLVDLFKKTARIMFDFKNMTVRIILKITILNSLFNAPP